MAENENSDKKLDDKNIDLKNDDKNDNHDVEKRGLLNDLKSERIKRQDLEKELQAIKDKQKEESDNKLKEKEQYKELLEKKETEWKQKETDWDKIKSELEEKANKWDSFENTKRDELKTLLADEWDDSMATIPIATLEKLVNKKYPEKIADTDGSGVKLNIKNLVGQLTEAEKKEARQKNISLETYVQLYKVKE